MALLYNLARMSTATTGTGTITLSAAVSGYLSFALAGVSNGDIVEYGISDGSNGEIGTGTYTTVGTTLTRNVTKSTNSNAAISLSGAAQVFISPRAERLQIPRSYLAGLTLSTAGASATFSIAAGQAADSTNLEILNLASSISKTTSAWAVGSGNGSLDAGTIANSTWYHAHLIYRPDTGVIDVLFSLSATAPTMPSSYTLFRRIGSIKTNGSAQWVLFHQLGDEFLWDAPVQDVNAAAIGTTVLTPTLSAPTGVQTSVLVSAACSLVGSFGGIFLYSPDLPNLAGSNMYGSIRAATSSNNMYVMLPPIRTNASAQIKAVAEAASMSYSVLTVGWIDTRGKLL